MSKQDTAGRFVWRELMAHDLEKSKGFYGELFNWSTNTMDMGDAGPYTLLKRDGEDVGGIAMVPEDHRAQAPPHWVSYITVDDVAAKAAQVQELGGKLLVGPITIPVGEFAIVTDAQGAAFALFRSETPGASDTDARPAEGEFCWQQLMTNDVDAAVGFYEKVFGWTTEAMPGGTGTIVVKRGEQMVATIMELPEMSAGAPPHWLNYVSVANVDESTTRATELGATVYKEPTDIPGMGRFSVLADSTGATLALWWQNPEAQM